MIYITSVKAPIPVKVEGTTKQRNRVSINTLPELFVHFTKKIKYPFQPDKRWKKVQKASSNFSSKGRIGPLSYLNCEK